MLIGDHDKFAIESEMSRAYGRPSLRALGFFVIHLAGATYGVRSVDATLLACSFDEVTARLRRRGSHNVFFSSQPDGGRVADAVGVSIYGPDDAINDFFGLSRAEFKNVVNSANIVWAPDGDQAFDDGSLVLQFDIADRVRLIGFRLGNNFRHDPSSLRDVWLGAQQFYDILGQWHSRFDAEWAATPKAPEN